jgi:E3 ubiquitin-protein ligase DOA10
MHIKLCTTLYWGFDFPCIVSASGMQHHGVQMCGACLQVLRPGVLYFLRDPADPNYNPFRDLIDDPIHKHARRVLLSVVVYGSLIVMLVFLPVQLAISIAPYMFPFDIR